MTYTIGIDLGIRKIAWAIHDGDKLTGTGAFEAAGGHRGEELYQVRDYLNAIVEELVESHYGDDEVINVFIEEPLIGNNRAYSMKIAQNYGSILSDLAYFTREHAHNPQAVPVNVFGVNVGTWKKQVLDDGHASKEKIKNYIDVVYGSYAALCGSDQDRYDAACVCLYGVLVAARADTLATRSIEESS